MRSFSTALMNSGDGIGAQRIADARICSRVLKPEVTDLTGQTDRTTYGDEWELAAGIRRREPQAMELLYDRLGGQAFGLAYRILGDGPSAEDVVQEAFLTLWRQAERLDPARGKVGSFLMTVVHHKAIDFLRSRRGEMTRHNPSDPPALVQEGSDVLESVAESLGRDTVRSALRSLPEEQRRPIELAYFEGLTHVEIADTLAIPLGTVKSRLRLGLEKMRRALAMETNR